MESRVCTSLLCTSSPRLATPKADPVSTIPTPGSTTAPRFSGLNFWLRVVSGEEKVRHLGVNAPECCDECRVGCQLPRAGDGDDEIVPLFQGVGRHGTCLVRGGLLLLCSERTNCLA
jgi:hypothetical protein